MLIKVSPRDLLLVHAPAVLMRMSPSWSREEARPKRVYEIQHHTWTKIGAAGIVGRLLPARNLLACARHPRLFVLPMPNKVRREMAMGILQPPSRRYGQTLHASTPPPNLDSEPYNEQQALHCISRRVTAAQRTTTAMMDADSRCCAVQAMAFAHGVRASRVRVLVLVLVLVRRMPSCWKLLNR